MSIINHSINKYKIHGILLGQSLLSSVRFDNFIIFQCCFLILYCIFWQDTQKTNADMNSLGKWPLNLIIYWFKLRVQFSTLIQCQLASDIYPFCVDILGHEKTSYLDVFNLSVFLSCILKLYGSIDIITITVKKNNPMLMSFLKPYILHLTLLNLRWKLIEIRNQVMYCKTYNIWAVLLFL